MKKITDTCEVILPTNTSKENLIVQFTEENFEKK